MFEDKCEKCRFLNYENSFKCPKCDNLTDMTVKGLAWTVKCSKCGYMVATTAVRLCYVAERIIPDSCFSKLEQCSYAERKKSDKEYDRICKKLGFIPSKYKCDMDEENDNWINPFSVLTMEEQDYLYNNGYLNKKSIDN